MVAGSSSRREGIKNRPTFPYRGPALPHRDTIMLVKLWYVQLDCLDVLSIPGFPSGSGKIWITESAFRVPAWGWCVCSGICIFACGTHRKYCRDGLARLLSKFRIVYKDVYGLSDTYLFSTIDPVIQSLCQVFMEFYSIRAGRSRWLLLLLINSFFRLCIFLPCFPLVNNQPQLSIVLYYSYRLDGVKLSGGNHFFSINHASIG